MLTKTISLFQSYPFTVGVVCGGVLVIALLLLLGFVVGLARGPITMNHIDTLEGK